MNNSHTTSRRRCSPSNISDTSPNKQQFSAKTTADTTIRTTLRRGEMLGVTQLILLVCPRSRSKMLHHHDGSVSLALASPWHFNGGASIAPAARAHSSDLTVALTWPPRFGRDGARPRGLKVTPAPLQRLDRDARSQGSTNACFAPVARPWYLLRQFNGGASITPTV